MLKVRQRSLVPGKHPQGRAQVDHDRGFDKAKGSSKGCARNELPPVQQQRLAADCKVGNERNQNEQVDPPGLCPEAELLNRGEILNRPDPKKVKAAGLLSKPDRARSPVVKIIRRLS